MAQLMPLPLTVSCFSKIQIGLIFLVPAHPGSPRKRAFKWVCVWVCVCVCDSKTRNRNAKLPMPTAVTADAAPGSCMTYLQRLLYDTCTNNECITTNILAKLIFQDHTDQKSGLFRDQQPIQEFYRPRFFFGFSGPFGTLQGPVGTVWRTHRSENLELWPVLILSLPSNKCLPYSCRRAPAGCSINDSSVGITMHTLTSVFSNLRTLTTWHCPHSPAAAANTVQ